jgi:hypothetical protein
MSFHLRTTRRLGGTLIAVMTTTAALLTTGTTAHAAIAPTVPLGTSANYAVLAGSTVTNTGPSTLDGSLGLSPGTSITGFSPGLVLPPGTIDKTNAAAGQAKADLTAAYLNAAGRPLDATTTANLANLKLGAGVYAGPSKSALSLTGPLVLDGAGDPSSVFIFQTNSTLITGSGSTVTLINGAQECNVFWQVGSSATLGTSSVFTGNILALTSITVTNSVTVHGRALALNAAVTLDNDTFTKPTCAVLPAGSTGGSDSTTTPVGGGTGTTATGTSGGGSDTTGTGTTGTGTTGGGGTTATTARGTGTTGTGTGTAGPRDGTFQNESRGGPGVPGIVGPPRTGAAPLPAESFPWSTVLFVGLFLGAELVRTARGRRVPAHSVPLAER